MKIKDFSDNLYLKDGIWFSKNKREISYPKKGNMICYEIEKNSFWFKHRNNCIIEAVKIYSKNETFFDIGGGNGYVAKGLEENNIETVLIEPGLDGVINARERGLKNIICSTFEDAGIKPNSCKAIGLFDVIEHIEDDKQFLFSIYSILSENGFVYITVPAYNTLWSRYDDYSGHFRRYTIKQLCSTLKEIGFEILYATYIFSILPIPIFIFRTIPSLFKFNNNSMDINKHKKEHFQKNSLLYFLLEKILIKELNYIKQKKKIPFGSSCFVIAKKSNALHPKT